MNPQTFEYLKKNVAESKFKNITIYNRGLSSKQGKCGIKLNIGNPLGGAQLDFTDLNEKSVELITLDDWFRDAAPPGHCRLIKIDVEGHELEVLKGSKTFLIENKPMLFMELKEINEFREVSSYLLDLGYVVAYAEPDPLPNFLFCAKTDLLKLFSDSELDQIRYDLCSRVVDAWQLHRKIKKLTVINSL